MAESTFHYGERRNACKHPLPWQPADGLALVPGGFFVADGLRRLASVTDPWWSLAEAGLGLVMLAVHGDRFTSARANACDGICAPCCSGVADATGLAGPGADRALDRLTKWPGFVMGGVIKSVFEIRWLHGYPRPRLPRRIGGYPVRLVHVAWRPIAYRAA